MIFELSLKLFFSAAYFSVYSLSAGRPKGTLVEIFIAADVENCPPPLISRRVWIRVSTP